MCDGGGVKIYGVSKVRNLRKYQDDNLVWDDRYAEWCDVSPAPETSSQESNKPRTRDYTFREWTFIKVGHTDYKKVHKDITYWWHDHGFKEDEHDEMGIEIEEYDPPEVKLKPSK
ncbi:hypothetical protein Tco_1460379 [Tanacetum coccineum]